MVSARTSLGAMERTYQGAQNLRTVLGRMTTLRALVWPSVKWSDWVKTGKSPFRCLMGSTPPSHILHRQSGGHHHSLGDMLGLSMVLILAAYRSPGRRNLIYSPIKVGKSGVHVGKQLRSHSSSQVGQTVVSPSQGGDSLQGSHQLAASAGLSPYSPPRGLPGPERGEGQDGPAGAGAEGS